MRNSLPSAGTTPSAESFVSGLRDEHSALASFTVLLQAEQDALVQCDAERVSDLAKDKSIHIARLTQLGEQRSRHLAAQSLSGTAEGMRTWLGRNPELATTTQRIWQDLLAQAKTAWRIHESNGNMIESQLQQIRHKLAVLRLSSPDDRVYSSDGRLRPMRSTRSFSQV
ncbi:MAG: flagellar protein FlgN [Comamonadaceae bacterium]